MGKRHFDVAQPDDAYLLFSLKAQVSHVYLCPDCGFVVAVFFPYRAAGFGEFSVVEYPDGGVVVTEEYLKEFLGDRMHECGRCSWVYVQAEAIREAI